MSDEFVIVMMFKSSKLPSDHSLEIYS